MTVNASAFFDEDRGHYRARFWDHSLSFDSTRKVSEQYWAELGIIPPPKSGNDKLLKLAQRWADRESVAIEIGLRKKPAARKMPFGEVWAHYKSENPDKVQPSTIVKNDLNAKTIGLFLSEKKLTALTPEEIDISIATKYRNWREEQNVSPRTVKNELMFMKQVCTFALAYSRDTGCEALRLVKLPYIELPDNDGVALTEDEFGRVLEKVKPRDQEIIQLGVTTRLRKNNLLGLRGEWFDRDERWLSISKELMKGVRGKKRPLSVPVAQWTLDVVGERAAGFLWLNDRTGGPIRHYEHILEEAIGKARVQPFTLHDLRTTGNSWLDRAGVDKLTRQVLMGHSPKSGSDGGGGIIDSIYTKKFVEQLREAVDVYDQIRGRNGW